MSFFSDIGNAVSSAVSSVANIAMEVAQVAFPPLAIAASVGNMLTQAVGQAVNGAAQLLCKELGMPKFLLDVIKDVVKDAIKDLGKPSDAGCDEAAGHHFGDQVKDIGNNLMQTILNGVKALQEGGDDDLKPGKGGKSSSTGWLLAIAKAMGSAAGKHAAEMVKLSDQIDKLNSKGGSTEEQQKAAQEASTLQTKFQAESQMFSMLQSSFSNAIKSIGEGMAQMARKG